MALWKADDDTSINFELYANDSDKDGLLLLHGLLGSFGSQWRPFVPYLTREYRVVLVDLRGHGHSGNEDLFLAPDRILKDVVGLLDYVGMRSVHVAGYDFGGYLGLMLQLQNPSRVSTLVMHATKFYWTKEAVSKMQAQLDPDVMGTKAPTYATQLAKEHGASHWRMLARQASDLIGFLSEQGLTEGMAAQAQGPVLVSVGDRDEVVPLPEADRLSRVMPKGSLLVLPRVRHPFQTVSMVPFLPAMQAFHRSPE